MNPFKGLKKVDNFVTGKTVTDGWGNLYEIPQEGYSRKVDITDEVSVRYNFKNNQVELLYKDEVVHSEGLNPTEWFDDPDYWADYLYDISLDEVARIIEHEEDFMSENLQNDSLELKIEDVVQKANGKWVNRGDDGTEHGEFETREDAIKQMRAMYASGYKGEDLELKIESDSITEAHFSIDDIKRKLDNFASQITIDKDMESEVSDLLRKKHIDYMIDDSRPGKLRYQLKYSRYEDLESKRVNEDFNTSYDDFYNHFRNKIKSWSTMASSHYIYEWLVEELQELESQSYVHNWGWDFSPGIENIAKELINKAKKEFDWLHEDLELKIEELSSVYHEEDLDILGATLLTVDEAKQLSGKLRAYDNKWWLKSPGFDFDFAAIVNYGGFVDSIGNNVSSDNDIVRPALIISNLESSDLKIGDTFEFGGKQFEIISDNRALCVGDIGYSVFRENQEASDANDYEKSDVKKYVDDWFNQHKGEEIKTESKKKVEEDLELKVSEIYTNEIDDSIDVGDKIIDDEEQLQVEQEIVYPVETKVEDEIPQSPQEVVDDPAGASPEEVENKEGTQVVVDLSTKNTADKEEISSDEVEKVEESVTLKEAYDYITRGDLENIIELIQELIDEMDDVEQDEIAPSPNTYGMRKFIGTPKGYINLNNIESYIRSSDEDDEESEEF